MLHFQTYLYDSAREGSIITSEQTTTQNRFAITCCVAYCYFLMFINWFSSRKALHKSNDCTAIKNRLMWHFTIPQNRSRIPNVFQRTRRPVKAKWLSSCRKEHNHERSHQGWEKPVFFQKTTHLIFFVLFEKKQRFLLFKETGFRSFSKKNTKTPFWIVFIASCEIAISRITQY